MEERRTKSRKRVVVVAVVVLLAGLLGWWVFGSRPVNILLLGLDEGKVRTDVVVVAHINPGRGIANLLSIPRDTLVEIDCRGLSESCVSPDKLAHAHVYGGPEATVKSVERLLGIDINHYVRVDFEGFKQVVDILGGVDLVIAQDMHYDDPYANPPLSIHFWASDEPQHLDGQAALEFVRFRGYTGDIGRTYRTKQFLVALAQKAKQELSLTTMASVIQAGFAYVDTDISVGTAMSLARGALGVNLDSVQMETLPGWDDPYNARGWVWIADEEQIPDVVKRLTGKAKPDEASGGESPVFREPTYQQPAYQEPANEEPVNGEPGAGEPGGEQPGVGEPGDQQPGAGEPGGEQPGTGEPGDGQPGAGEPGDGQPGTGEPGDRQPGAGEPGGKEPGAGKPGTGKPGGEQPGTGEPGDGQPGAGEPGGERPGSGEPGGEEPAAGKPGGEESGSDQPGGGEDPGSGQIGVGELEPLSRVLRSLVEGSSSDE